MRVYQFFTEAQLDIMEYALKQYGILLRRSQVFDEVLELDVPPYLQERFEKEKEDESH